MNESFEKRNVSVTVKFGSMGYSLVTVLQLFTVDNWHYLFLTMEEDGIVNKGYVYIFIISWLFIGHIMFKNIFVGIMVMNFKTIRDDFNDQCLEREEDLEIGQKGRLCRERLVRGDFLCFKAILRRFLIS